jgi:hypothetical protein
VLSVVGGVLGIWWFLTHWDPSRTLWKRWSQPDPYRYEKTDPRFLELDLASTLHVKDGIEVHNTRSNLIELIWQARQLPLEKRPQKVTNVYAAESWSIIDRFWFGCPSFYSRVMNQDKICFSSLYGGMSNLDRIDLIHIPVRTGYIAIAAHFRPERKNGGLVVFHQGLAGTYHDQHGHIGTLLDHGFAVIAFNQPGYGDYGGKVHAYEDAEIAMFVEPVVVGIGYALQAYGYNSVDMIGFSAGAWVTAISAAVDTRIRRSYAIAGILPAGFRRPSESAPPQLSHKLLGTVSYMDLFVLGAVGSDRGQLQIFNRFDSCCFDGTRGLLYESLVQEATSQIGSGRFRVFIDESHAMHKISAAAFQQVVDDMMRR